MISFKKMTAVAAFASAACLTACGGAPEATYTVTCTTPNGQKAEAQFTTSASDKVTLRKDPATGELEILSEGTFLTGRAHLDLTGSSEQLRNATCRLSTPAVPVR
jgi:hypothetical protein